MTVQIRFRAGRFAIVQTNGGVLFGGFDTRADAEICANAMGWKVTP